jgi:hypothetical protein
VSVHHHNAIISISHRIVIPLPPRTASIAAVVLSNINHYHSRSRSRSRKSDNKEYHIAINVNRKMTSIRTDIGNTNQLLLGSLHTRHSHSPNPNVMPISFTININIRVNLCHHRHRNPTYNDHSDLSLVYQTKTYNPHLLILMHHTHNPCPLMLCPLLAVSGQTKRNS